MKNNKNDFVFDLTLTNLSNDVNTDNANIVIDSNFELNRFLELEDYYERNPENLLDEDYDNYYRDNDIL